MSKWRICVLVSLLIGCGGDITEPDPDPCDQTVTADGEIIVRPGQTIYVVFEFAELAR